MDKIEALVKKLEELKEELNKASKDPKLASKDVKVKELQGKIDAGTYKPDAAKIADKMLKGTNEEPTADLDNEVEKCSIAKNGQWKMEKSIKPKKEKYTIPSNFHEWKKEDLVDHIQYHDKDAHKLPLHEWSEGDLHEHIHELPKKLNK